MALSRPLRDNVKQALNELKTNPEMAAIQHPPLRRIKYILFGILSPDEMEAVSVCKITKSKISVPFTETVYDERLGPSNSKSECLTCRETKKCPGHFGHIDLAVPIIHPQFARHLVSISNCFCLKCSKCKITKEELELEMDEVLDDEAANIEFMGGKGQAKLIKSEKLCSTVSYCSDPECEEICPQIVLFEGKIYKVYQEGKKKHKNVIPLDELQIFLKNISNEDLEMIGIPIVYRDCYKYNGKVKESIPSFRPEWLILTKLPVLPTVSRPPDYEGGIKSDDDLTYSYTEIIKNNQKLLDGKKLNEKSRQDTINTLEIYISSFIDNKDEKVKQTSGKPIKSIKERISSKHGHIRGKLLGKRVDCCARSVITADPNIDLDEVGVAEQIAKELSFPETVSSKNFAVLNSLLNENKINMITRDSKLYINNIIKESDKKIKLRVGDRVFRQLQDGDTAIFNRQPTLHRGGMMKHRVKILPGKTLRMNPSATKPYNADFDGDEMQIHVPQNEESCTEAKEIMSVNKMIVSSQSNKPIIGAIQDCLIGSNILTQKGFMVKKHQFFDCLYSAGKIYVDNIHNLFNRAAKYNIPLLSGRCLFSGLLPSDFKYKVENDGSKEEKTVIIENGILIEGVINSKIIGTAYDSIGQNLYRDYGDERASRFITDLQRLINKFLIFNGFSVGISDFVIPKENKEEIKNSISTAFIEVDAIENSQDPRILKEVKINNALNNRGQNLAIKGLRKGNRLQIMIESGSKGNKMNVIQIVGHLGQNNVEGRRIQPEIDDSQRTLWCFDRNNTNPVSKGFIKSSFMDGLSPYEMWFHAKAGREGVINTAVKTRESGYAERKLVKRMEDSVVEQDYSIKNSVGNIIEFNYGLDNLNATFMVNPYNKKGCKFMNIHKLADYLNMEIIIPPKNFDILEKV